MPKIYRIDDDFIERLKDKLYTELYETLVNSLLDAADTKYEEAVDEVFEVSSSDDSDGSDGSGGSDTSNSSDTGN